jgi:hypothetical protein
MKTNFLEKPLQTAQTKKYTLRGSDNTPLALNKSFIDLVKPIEDSPMMFNLFHWVVNHEEQDIVHCFGVKKMLGYDDQTLTYEKSQNLIHPNFRGLILKLSAIVFDFFKSSSYQVLNKQAHFCIQFPIQHINGSFLLIQQNCTVLSTDKDHNPVIVYYRFENLGKFIGFPIIVKPRVCFNIGIYSIDLEQVVETQLSKGINSLVLKHIGLTTKQTEILSLLSQEKSIDQITKELNITIETIKVHNKNILSKAKKNISQMFTNAREVSYFLKEELVI